MAREKLAEANWKAKQASRASTERISLVDFVHEVSPHLDAPTWLAPYAQILERAVRPTRPARPEDSQLGSIRAAVAAPPQHGKAIDVETPMLTRRGFVRAGDIKLGDELVGSDGNWTEVTGVFPQGEVDLFSVQFDDGTALRTCAEHRWLVSQRYGYAASVKTTAELSSDIHEADGRHKWRIPVAKSWRGVTQGESLPLDPYLLGAWLGDGTSRAAAITSADDEIVGRFVANGYPTTYRYPAGKATTYGLKGGFLAKLKLLGLLRNKHIPDAYLFSAPEHRLALLQGLCDTDGTVAKNGSQQSYCTTSETLAWQFRFLVNSLGGVCSDIQRQAAAKTAHNIYFRLPSGVSGFGLRRKSARLNPPSPRSVPRRFVTGVTPAGRGDAVCFSVAAEDRLFCAGRELIVTHNTELTLRAYLWWDRFYPGLRHAYVTYNKDRAEWVAKEFIRIATEAGFQPEGTLDELRLRGGSTVRFTSIGGGLTGYALDGCCVIDDPIKDAADARSAAVRRDCSDWWSGVAKTRRHPGTSFVAMATRWHVDDLSGHLIKNWNFQYVNLKAIAEARHSNDVDADGRVLSDPLGRSVGESLWPARKPPDFFAEDRRDAFTWASMFQGEPRPAGGAVFSAEPSLYRELPREGYRGAFGLDLAYTAKTHADWSILIEGVAIERDELGPEGKPVKRIVLYIVDVQRKQVDAPSFALTLKARQVARPTYRMRWYAAGTEMGPADFLKRQGIKLNVMRPAGDKLVRATRVAAAWNSGRVLLPDPEVFPSAWLAPFLDVVQNFTGVNDPVDDDVDALSALHDELDTPKPPGSGVVRTYESPLNF